MSKIKKIILKDREQSNSIKGFIKILSLKIQNDSPIVFVLIDNCCSNLTRIQFNKIKTNCDFSLECGFKYLDSIIIDNGIYIDHIFYKII